nr:sigma-70 family RNA polymerase sigma factor [Kofleriaceae bacterium]
MTKPAVPAQYSAVSDPDRDPGSSLASFDAVYEREYEPICRTLGRLGVPAGDVPDAAHDVFVVLYRRWTEVDMTRVRPWLYGVARKIAAVVREKRRRDQPADIDPPSPAALPDTRVAQRDFVWRALDALADDRREVVVLHDMEGYTGAEIAAMLDVPVNTVHSRLRLARAELVTAVRRLRGEP